MSVKPSHILGMNARHHYTKMNPGSAKRYGFSKLLAKELFNKNNIPTPQIYHVFESPNDLEHINWETIPTPFVVKPANGLAGKGVWVIKRKLKHDQWLNSFGEQLTAEDLSLHVYNILDGEFSVWGINHKALVEEMVPAHPALARYTYKGTPDIRVVVFNSIPVMAMARIPTKESGGRANLDQGAIGLGIDMANGITTHGIYGKKEYISRFPHLKKKTKGILIPHWTELLEIAVTAANAAGYMYMGADLFIHPDKGPVVVELNGYPGLSIQLANRAGLKRRLERVEGLEVRNVGHGVKIAKALFAESFVDSIRAKEGLQIISVRPRIGIFDDFKGQVHSTEALVNTSRFRSAISAEFAEELGLVDLEDLLWQQRESIEGKVPVVEVSFRLKSKKVNTAMVVIKRLNRTKHKVELGRKDVQDFLVGDMVS